MKILYVVLFAWSCSLSTGSAQTSVSLMTSETSSRGVVTHFGLLTLSYPGWSAIFDGGDNDLWILVSGENPAWIGYEIAGDPGHVVRYAINHMNDGMQTRAATNWTGQASDGQGWPLIDTRFNQTEWSGYEEPAYAFGSPGF